MLLPKDKSQSNVDLQFSGYLADAFRPPIRWRKFATPQADIHQAAAELKQKIGAAFDDYFPANAASNIRRIKALEVLAKIDPDRDTSDTVQSALREIRSQPASTAFSLKTDENGKFIIPFVQRAAWPRLSDLATALKEYAGKARNYDVPDYPPVEHLGMRDSFSGQLQKIGNFEKNKDRKVNLKDLPVLRSKKQQIDGLLNELVPQGRQYDRVRQHVVDMVMERADDVAKWKRINEDIAKKSTGEFIPNGSHYAMFNTFAGINERKVFELDRPLGKPFEMSEQQARDLSRMIRAYHEQRPTGPERSTDTQPPAKRARIDTHAHPELVGAVSKEPARPAISDTQKALAREIHTFAEEVARELAKKTDATKKPSLRKKLAITRYVFDNRFEIGKIVPREKDQGPGIDSYPTLDAMRSRQPERFGKAAVALERLYATFEGKPPRALQPGVDWDAADNNPLYKRSEKPAKQEKAKPQIDGQSSITSFFSPRIPKAATPAVDAIPRGLEARPSRDTIGSHERSL